MPVIIRNLGSPNPAERDDPDGERYYSVSINDEEQCRFVHRRGDGLATCLARAALAVANTTDETLTIEND